MLIFVVSNCQGYLIFFLITIPSKYINFHECQSSVYLWLSYFSFKKIFYESFSNFRSPEIEQYRFTVGFNYSCFNNVFIWSCPFSVMPLQILLK